MKMNITTNNNSKSNTNTNNTMEKIMYRFDLAGVMDATTPLDATCIDGKFLNRKDVVKDMLIELAPLPGEERTRNIHTAIYNIFGRPTYCFLVTDVFEGETIGLKVYAELEEDYPIYRETEEYKMKKEAIRKAMKEAEITGEFILPDCI